MEMDELQAMRQTFRLKEATRFDQACRIEPELRVFATARGPFAPAFAVQPHSNPDMRLDSDLLGNADRLLQLLDFLDDQDNRFAEPTAHHRGADVGAILVAVADDE